MPNLVDIFEAVGNQSRQLEQANATRCTNGRRELEQAINNDDNRQKHERGKKAYILWRCLVINTFITLMRLTLDGWKNHFEPI